MQQTAGDAGLPVIAIAGPSQYTGPIARDLGYLSKNKAIHNL